MNTCAPGAWRRGGAGALRAGCPSQRDVGFRITDCRVRCEGACGRCRFWFYGDDPVEERLARLGSYLDTYDARTDIESLVPKQPLFAEPRKVVGYYAAGNAEVRATTASA